jgi:NodT family efflux transporter outer membrane factor (OMF) lipoprotein
MCSPKDKRPITLRGIVACCAVVSLASMAVALSGCTVGPDYAKPEARLNENWAEKNDPNILTQAAINSEWWKTFNDPVLDQLVQQAYHENLTLQVAGLRILEARARLGIAIGEQYPQQNVFGSVSNVGLSTNAANSAGLDRSNWNYQAGFDATWEIDFWGKFRRNVEAAQGNLIGTAADYDDALVSLTAEVARTYTLIRTYEALIELTRENARVQEEGLTIAESRFRNGVTTELDVMQARTLLESTRATIPQLEARWRQSQNVMSTLLGQPTGAVQEKLAGAKGIPTAPAQVGVSMPAELLRRRPDIRSAELFAAAQCARIGIAKADLYPSFSLVGEVGLQTSSQGGVQSSGAQFHNFGDEDSLFYSFGPGINWPIFSYGRIKNFVRVQDAQFQQLLVNYQDTVLRASQEVEDALTGFVKSREAVLYNQNSVAAAQRSVEISLAQYREGAVDYQRVLDAQRSLLQEQNSLTQTQSSIATSMIALYKALGGGWELRQGQPIVPDSMQTEMRKRTDWGRLVPAEPAPDTSNPPVPAREIPVLGQPTW